MKTRILAGVSGKRLGSVSREQYPKQFLRLGNYSSFQGMLLRCLEFFKAFEVFVVKNITQRSSVSDQIEKENWKSNVGLLYLDRIIHYISNKNLSSAEHLATEYPAFDIFPTHYHTGYGYIKPEEAQSRGYRASDFREKPDFEAATRHIEGNYLKNSEIPFFNTNDEQPLNFQTAYCSWRMQNILDLVRSLKEILSILINLSGPCIQKKQKRKIRSQIKKIIPVV